VFPRDFQRQQPGITGVWDMNSEGAAEDGVYLPLQDASALGRYYVSVGW
jgi:hypothetical protein